jgi:hypothetical protein
MSAGRAVHRWACAVSCGAFLVLSGPQIRTALTAGTLGTAEPFHSTDQDIEGLSGMRNGSERIRQTLAALPGGRPVAILLPEHDATAAYFGLMVAYLGWPRAVEAIAVPLSDANEKVRALNPAKFAGFLFCRVPPPAFVPRGKEWGPGLVFVVSPAAGSGAP